MSDLVTAQELAAWRKNRTTKRVLAYLSAWREQLKNRLAEGESLFPTADASAMKTTEMVSKAQLLEDILNLEASDIAAFYGLEEPKEPE